MKKLIRISAIYVELVQIIICGLVIHLVPVRFLAFFFSKSLFMQILYHFDIPLGIPQMILLTKIDKVCPKVEEDVSQVFRSVAILEQVEKVSQLLGTPRNNMLPIKNYETEIELNDNINILALIALSQMLRASEDYMFNFLDDFASGSDNAPALTARD